MAQKAIREFTAKKIIQNNWSKYISDLHLNLKSHLVTVDEIHIPDWLNDTSLVVKPDMCFGKRSKNNLVLLNANHSEAIKWIESKTSNEHEVFSSFDKKNYPQGESKKGQLTHFLIEEFTPHKSDEEYYISFQTESDYDVINFSTTGGVDIEENWDKAVKTIQIKIFTTNEELEDQIKTLHSSTEIQNFIKGMYFIFKDCHFSYLEINPFLLIDKTIILLDTVAKLDDTAELLMLDNWGSSIEFPTSFGMPDKSLQVKEIEELDKKTGASLKLTILNPKGSIWTLLAGGGASIVAIDALTESLESYHEIANYGEYSGNPTSEETFQYADRYLQLLTAHPEVQNKKLIISGAIANFTDIAKTFQGIIKAIQKHSKNLKEQKVEIFVRRGGPNYKKGLKNIEQACQALEIPILVHGPEIGITDICNKAISQKLS